VVQQLEKQDWAQRFNKHLIEMKGVKMMVINMIVIMAMVVVVVVVIVMMMIMRLKVTTLPSS